MSSILYKYRDFGNSNHRKSLFEQELYLASTADFNDPYEGSIPFLYDPEVLTPENIFKKLFQIAKNDFPDWSDEEIHEYCFEAQKKKLLNDPSHLSKEQQKTKEEIERKFGILSLSKNPLNYLMWSHYAAAHKGFVIGLDREILFNSIQGALGPVTYADSVPYFQLMETVEDFYIKLLATKGIFWEYEEEYRFTHSGGSRKTFKVDISCIREVYLGCRMALDDKLYIVNYIKSNINHIQVFDVKLHPNRFELEAIRIF